jgi:multidrug transporter EmrE-like cation transporter
MTKNEAIIQHIPLILASVTMNALAQVFLKIGMTDVGKFQFDINSIASRILPVATNKFIIGGMTCYAVSIGLWLLVLSRTEVSAAYPFLSVGYVIVAFLGYFVFHDALTLTRIGGIALICSGVVLISRS